MVFNFEESTPLFATRMYREMCVQVAVILADYVHKANKKGLPEVELLHEPLCNLAKTMLFLQVTLKFEPAITKLNTLYLYPACECGLATLA